uniref:Dilute domain-containing protein n=1 Tax=Oryza sativa subsp. japonica TaxID=39947 RepID=Q53WM0_ORYSJ|nr:unknown protein [Oryza sativa Japonica Group]
MGLQGYQCAWRIQVAKGKLRKLKMAARDTEALKVEKGKLEEHIEELSSRLCLEKKLRTTLHEMERRVEEARATQERESAKKVVEEALVLEREKIALLTKEVEELKSTKGLETSLMMERQQNEANRREVGEAQQRVEELLRLVADANGKSTSLQTTVQSLIEKEATWLTERQESETTNKLLIEAHGRNEELLNKIEVAENDISKFRDNIQRLITIFNDRFEETATTLETSLLAEKQHSAAIMSQLAETKQGNEELQKKLADVNRTNDILQDSLKRFEENVTTRDALYLAERQEHDETKQSLSKSQERNWELLQKVDEAEKRINKLLENAQRLEKHATARESLLLKTKQSHDSTTKALVEAESRNRELTKSFEDSDRKINLLEDSVNRLEERIAEKDSLLEIERQENNATKDEVTNAQNKIMELVNESQQLQDIRKHLEDNIKRLEEDATTREALLISEKQTHEATKRTLTETQLRNEELINKIQDSDKHALQLELTIERLQENASTMEALLLREREQSNATMKAHSESQERNSQLLKKFEDVDKKIGLLQGAIQRLGEQTTKDTLLLSERKEKDELKKVLSETEYRNEELVIKIEEENKKVEHLQDTITMLKENIAVQAANLEAERQENDRIRKSLVEAQERNDELFKKVSDSEYRAQQLQDTVQKLQVDAISRLSSFVMERQESDAVRKALAESHGRNEDLIRRNDDLLSRNDDLIKKIEDSGQVVAELQAALESAQPVDGPSGLQQIDAKYPALLFKQQLVDLIEKVYGMISDKVKKELNPLLELCIQDPRTSHSNQAKASLSSASHLGQQSQLTHWLGIVKILNNCLHLLRANHFADSAWEALRHIRQAVDFLVPNTDME